MQGKEDGRGRHIYKIVLYEGLKFLLVLTYSYQNSYTKNHARFQYQILGFKEGYR